MRAILAACLGFTALIATSAHADIITDSFTGTIANGSDTDNLFGGGSLAGQAVSGSLTFDTSQLNYALSAGSENYTGGGNGSFLLSLTIGGTTVNQTVSFGEIVAQAAGADTEFTIAGFSGVGPSITFEVNALGPWSAGVIDQSFELDPDYAGQRIFVGGDSFTITPTAGGGSESAPEPATAFLLGSGLIALRVGRRRRA